VNRFEQIKKEMIIKRHKKDRTYRERSDAFWMEFFNACKEEDYTYDGRRGSKKERKVKQRDRIRSLRPY